MSSNNFLPEVKEQYEVLPYPQRNPEDEQNRLISTVACPLPLINHYLFRGQQTFQQNFRCLVAGGGTGDAAIFLAQQLKEYGGQVVYLDLSNASQTIAKKRAEIRGLDNIEFHQGSLLDVSDMGLGEFDFINCSGVLHHLEDPEAGLTQLKSVLKASGGMSIMVYALHGRAGVYQMQELMRLANDGVSDKALQITNGRRLWDSLPEYHIIKAQNPAFKSEITAGGDSGLYDLFLHSQDRAYSIPQLYQWFDDCEVDLVTLIGSAGQKNRYRIEKHIADPAIFQQFKSKSVPEQQAMAELLDGRIIKHTAFVTHKNRDCSIASTTNIDNIPFFYNLSIEGDKLPQIMQSNPGRAVHLSFGAAGELVVPSSIPKAALLRYMDGETSLENIFIRAKKYLAKSGKQVDIDRLKKEFDELFESFAHFDFMLLRGKDIPRYKSASELQALMTERCK